MATPRLQQSIDDAALSLLNQVDRDPHSRTRGCCDRRYWAWKLVDFPDATLQRAVQPLAYAVSRGSGSFPIPDAAVVDTVRSALVYLGTIQHRDGSFDQAYPHEHSVAGTAFILDSAIAAMPVVEPACDAASRAAILQMFERAAGFLCRQDETHGAIGNHVAGSILALVRAEQLMTRAEYGARADALLDVLLASQSDEGWFPEYGGCDPGYMSLCVYYLAQVQRVRPRATLAAALERAVVFLSHFVHPDGTFGGVYGSRRTAVYYPGGIALLGATLPMAARMTRRMLASAEARRLVGPGHPDVGNAVPVLANYQLAIDAASRMVDDTGVRLPYEAGESADFPNAGLYLRASSSMWTIVGASNGGTVAVWDRVTGGRLHDDGGWMAEAGERRWTTQVTAPAVKVSADRVSVALTVPFRVTAQRVPSVLPFVALRLASFALQWPSIGERVKALMVRVLMTSGSTVDARTERTVMVSETAVDVQDVLSGHQGFWQSLTRLTCGVPFNAIHMASAGYVVPTQRTAEPMQADLRALAATGRATARVHITSVSTSVLLTD